jgi:LEA14-like dessication related protein
MMFFTACSSSFREAPDVHILGLRVDDVSLFSTKLEVKVRVENDSQKELRTQGSKHKIYLGDTLLGVAKSSNELVVPALGDATETLHLSLNHLKAFHQIEEMIKTPNQSYRVESTVYLDSFLGLQSLSSVTEGELPFASSLSRE